MIFGASLRNHRPAPDGAQKRILAHRQQQPACHPLSRASAERPAEMLHQPVQPLRPPGEAPGNRRLQPFREDPTGAFPLRAPEAPHLDADHDVTPMRRQVGQLPSIPTANHPRHHAAGRDRPRHPPPERAKTLTDSAVLSTRSTTNPRRSNLPPTTIRPHRAPPSMTRVRRPIRPENGKSASRLIQSPILTPDRRPIFDPSRDERRA